MNNPLAVVSGLVIGSVINFGLITVGMSVYPLPDGIDGSDMAALREAMKHMTPESFVFPLLGHGLGTLVGAFVTAFLAKTRQTRLAMAIGIAFLIGGILMILNCGGPLWFIVTDLALAYLPMAALGAFVAGKIRRNSIDDFGTRNG